MEHVTATVEGQTIVCPAKTFSTGSTGYYGTQKIILNGDRYQVSVQAVKIGSKPADPKKPRK